MTPIRVVVPDTGPLITLAKLHALDVLLAFEETVRIVLTDYVDFEATRHRHRHPDAKAIHNFIVANAGRVEIMATSMGKNYKELMLIQERLANSPEIAAQLGISLEPPSDPGEMTIVELVSGLIERPPGVPTLILAEDEYFLNPLAPLPGNAHVVSTRAFLNRLPHIANLKTKPELWAAVLTFRTNAESAKSVDRPAAKIPTSWESVVRAGKAREAVSAFRKQDSSVQRVSRSGRNKP